MTKPDGKQAHKIVHFGDYYNLRLVDTNHGKERQLVIGLEVYINPIQVSYQRICLQGM